MGEGNPPPRALWWTTGFCFVFPYPQVVTKVTGMGSTWWAAADPQGLVLTSWDGLFETEQACGFTLQKLTFTF